MKCKINILENDKLNFNVNSYKEFYSNSSADISKLWESEKLGFHLEILHPKKFSCPYHFHHDEEELFLVLKGQAQVRQDNTFYEAKEGDLILFKTGVAHQFYNHTSKPFIFFSLSNKSPTDICEYPDSKKKWERKSKKLTQDDSEVYDYWLGEENPRSNWPEKLL